jgi:NTP pyrophosphatase (non-canonical NTP hydrolase)
MVSEFNKKRIISVDRSLRALDLSSEIGEVCKLAFSEGVGKKIEINKWEEELGDVLYSLLSLMSELDIEAEKALTKVLEKYHGRISNRNSMDSGS